MGKRTEKDRRRIGAAAGRRFAPGWLRLKVLRRDQYRCRYCRRGVTNAIANMDHVVPWPEGLTEFENLRTACPECNRRKGRKRLGQTGHGKIERGVIARVHTSRWLGMRDSAPEENGPVRVRRPISVSPPW